MVPRSFPSTLKCTEPSVGIELSMPTTVARTSTNCPMCDGIAETFTDVFEPTGSAWAGAARPVTVVATTSKPTARERRIGRILLGGRGSGAGLPSADRGQRDDSTPTRRIDRRAAPRGCGSDAACAVARLGREVPGDVREELQRADDIRDHGLVVTATLHLV